MFVSRTRQPESETESRSKKERGTSRVHGLLVTDFCRFDVTYRRLVDSDSVLHFGVLGRLKSIAALRPVWGPNFGQARFPSSAFCQIGRRGGTLGNKKFDKRDFFLCKHEMLTVLVRNPPRW
jgi:hypothetical protein